jgi:glycosyltransferase involved in cell wall biosynthesis
VGGFNLVDPRKRLDLLLKAFSLLVKTRKEPIILVLAGTLGPYGESLKRQVNQLGLTSRVRFTDYIPSQDLAPLYNAARICVFPSSYEGFGLPLVEAMACGTPLVAFRNSSIPEVVGDGGLLLDQADAGILKEAVSAILSNEEYARELSRRALQQARNFSWDKTAEQTLDVYREVACRTQKGKGKSTKAKGE